MIYALPPSCPHCNSVGAWWLDGEVWQCLYCGYEDYTERKEVIWTLTTTPTGGA